MMDLFAQGIKDNKQMLLNTVTDAFNFQDLITAPMVALDGGYGTNAGATQSYSNVYNINIQGETKSAADVARALREEAQYGIIGGGGFGD
jgi:hypothetical protein